VPVGAAVTRMAALQWLANISVRRPRLPCACSAAILPRMVTLNRRLTAKLDGDFVVFLIGARINRWWKLPQHLWFLGTMPKMLKELAANPASGFLGYESLSLTIVVQYWRSLEQLIAYARNRDHSHYPMWVKFNKAIGSNGDIGIWHETYLVRAGEYEAIYNNMPAYGLGKVGKQLDAVGAQNTSSGRLGRSDGGDAPIAPSGEKLS